MVAIAESTPGPVAVNSATYIGYKIEGAAGAAASTVAVCLPSFAVIYLISLFFDQFLRLSVVASAFHGIQVCVIYLILSAGLKMLKQLEHSVFNIVILTTVAAAMVGCSIAAVSFSSIFTSCSAVRPGCWCMQYSSCGRGRRSRDLCRTFLEFSHDRRAVLGGGYGMISLVRETVLGRGWLTEGEFLSFIAVSESTPGPLAINMATFIGASQGGFWGALCATLGVVLPSFVIILLVASVLQNLMKYAGVNAVLGGVRPCVVAMILATAVNMALSTLAGFAADKAGIAPDLRSIVVFLLLWGLHALCRRKKGKAPSPIGMILLSAGLGILFWGIKITRPGGSSLNDPVRFVVKKPGTGKLSWLPFARLQLYWNLGAVRSSCNRRSSFAGSSLTGSGLRRSGLAGSSLRRTVLLCNSGRSVLLGLSSNRSAGRSSLGRGCSSGGSRTAAGGHANSQSQSNNSNANILEFHI